MKVVRCPFPDSVYITRERVSMLEEVMPNTFVRKVIARFGQCLRTLFRIPFGPQP
jgi:hypothetical protein